ncbi:MAG: FMN-binding glutamate synthase family protein [Deltaproteobacteria bacterium]|nr:FMN-binding glutamate synthase family protein [Deltaproteobacteria bacterium]
MRKAFLVSAVVVPAAIILIAVRWPLALWSFVLVAPLVLLGLHDVLQRRHSLLRNYPIIGHGRRLMEDIRPEIQQYFVEGNTDGTPFSREFRSVVYQRAKGTMDTVAFGTQRDVDRIEYEWMNHSLAPKTPPEREPRVRIGGSECAQPYDASHLNISGMSFGALSKNAILALNGAAAKGGFCHNTGEGGLSAYHLAPGGGLVWQVGTGYFGCRTSDGRFDPGLFAENAARESVKMIEIKLSQGAKPGHGGILPAAKLTEEIAGVRGVPLGHDVVSPPAHTAFDGPRGLLEFVARLREMSKGKPVGFKLCVGHPSEFLGICKAMVETGLRPDFITVDGGEGGTGAAPLELSNSVGTPLREGLVFVRNSLAGIGVRDQVRIIAAGKITTGFHLFRAMALGADLCNSARGMMMALGCIQARKCNTNTCPVGVATQDPSRTKALDVSDKTRRVYNFQRATIRAFLELAATAGLEGPDEIRPEHVLHREEDHVIRHLGEVYPCLPEGRLLQPDGMPDWWRVRWQAASADRF